MSDELEFEHIDADAVCEQCGTVNPEETLLCKTCGNNLKEQRQQRISQSHATPMPVRSVADTGFRFLTGLLSVLGILLVLLVVLNLSKIEAAFVDVLASQNRGVETDLFSGEAGRILDELNLELESFPSSIGQMVEAIEVGLLEESYSGRYVLVDSNSISRGGIRGEAFLRRVGETVYFAALSRDKNIQVRGVATVTPSDEIDKLVTPDAAVEIGGNRYLGWGLSAPEQDGGHVCLVQCDYGGGQIELLAYRIR